MAVAEELLHAIYSIFRGEPRTTADDSFLTSSSNDADDSADTCKHLVLSILYEEMNDGASFTGRRRVARAHQTG
jgi:hypothetical protein